MAKQISSELAQRLTCAVCLEVFSDPVELKCRHTFCKVCVTRLISDGSIACPKCRTVTPAHDILKDFKMAEMVSMLHATSHSSVNVMCELCDHLPSEIHCKQCNKLLCPSCSKTHRKYENCSESSSMPIAEIENKFSSQLNRGLHRVSDWLKFLDGQKQRQIDVVDGNEQAVCEILDKVHVKAKELVEKHFTKLKEECFEKSQHDRDYVNAAFADLAKDGKDHQSFLKDCQRKSSLSEKVQLLQSNSFDKTYDCELPIPHHSHYNVMTDWNELTMREVAVVHEVGTDLVLEGCLKKILPLQDGNFAVLCKTKVYLMTNKDNKDITYRKFELETKNARSMTLTSDNKLLIATSDCGLVTLPLHQKWGKRCKFQVECTGNFLDVTCVHGENGFKAFALKMDESCNNDASVVAFAKRVFIYKLVSAEGTDRPKVIPQPDAVTLKEECITTCACSNSFVLLLDGNCLIKIGQDGVVTRKDSLVKSKGGVPTDLQFTTSIATKEVFIVNKQAREVYKLQVGGEGEELVKIPLPEVKDALLPRFESVAKLTNNAWVIGCQLGEAAFKFQLVMECDA